MCMSIYLVLILSYLPFNLRPPVQDFKDNLQSKNEGPRGAVISSMSIVFQVPRSIYLELDSAQ
jgi:hypothetical protein